MARKINRDNLFAITEPDDPVRAYGVGMKMSEWAKLEEIAKALSMKRHELAVWAVRDFMRRWAAGEIETETKKTLPGQ